MSKVHILPEEIVSKIAAGEVIERPASVVKELIENALDAKADTIEIVLKEAGKTLIQVKDNGHGIEREDLGKIFGRHATSKIETIADLYTIRTLGFRGEALYSIAAVADVTLRSKIMEAPAGSTPACPAGRFGETNRGGTPPKAGWQIHVRGGKQLDLRPCPMAANGTEIEIKELFFNTPARKKFLKSNTTEINQILNIFIPYTLLHPNMRFKLTHQNRGLLDLAPSDNIVSRIAHALNLDEKHILNVETRHAASLHIRLILGDINIRRSRRDMQFIFVNQRPVQNKNISYHMNQIYRLIMPDDAFPFFAVYLEVPPEEVDVNIHPTKREVKIKNEQNTGTILRHLCEEALLKWGQIKTVTSGQFSVVGQDDQDVIERALMEAHTSPLTYDSCLPPEIGETQISEQTKNYAYPKASTQQFFIPPLGTGLPAGRQGRDLSLQKRLEQAAYIGSFINKFLLFESGTFLLVVDQHAAAERITYEQLIRQMEKGLIEVQHLLSPVVVNLSPQEFLVWEETQELLNKAGFSTTQLDKETIAVHTHPQLLKDIEKAMRELLAGEDPGRCDFDTLARRACRASVMAGDRLNKTQAEFLREQLLQCLDPFTCPHGRPTVVEMTEGFLDKQFLRI